MREKLEKIKETIQQAEDAPAYAPLQKAALAKQAIDETNELIEEMIWKIERLERACAGLLP